MIALSISMVGKIGKINQIYFLSKYMQKIYEVPPEVPIIDLFHQSSIHKIFLINIYFPTQIFQQKPSHPVQIKKEKKTICNHIENKKTLLVRYQNKNKHNMFRKLSMIKKKQINLTCH